MEREKKTTKSIMDRLTYAYIRIIKKTDALPSLSKRKDDNR